MKKISFLVSLAIILTVSSCKKETTTTSCGNGTFTCTINGAAYTTASTNESTLLKTTTGGTPVKRMDIRAKASDGKYVILTITNLQNAGSGDGVIVKTYSQDPLKNYSNAAGYEGAIITYSQGTSSTLGQAAPMPGSTGTITITACDATNHTVNGTFSMTLDNYSSGSDYVVTGSFSNVCYTVK